MVGTITGIAHEESLEYTTTYTLGPILYGDPSTATAPSAVPQAVLKACGLTQSSKEDPEINKLRREALAHRVFSSGTFTIRYVRGPGNTTFDVQPHDIQQTANLPSSSPFVLETGLMAFYFGGTWHCEPTVVSIPLAPGQSTAAIRFWVLAIVAVPGQPVPKSALVSWDFTPPVPSNYANIHLEVLTSGPNAAYCSAFDVLTMYERPPFKTTIGEKGAVTCGPPSTHPALSVP